MKTVFISYTHDNNDYKIEVKKFADYLIAQGVDCEFDQYTPFPQEGWPKWMVDGITKANFVLIFCSENYKNKVENTSDLPSGANWEGAYIRTELYQSGRLNSKFFPVVFNASMRQFVPNYLKDYTCFNLSDKGDVEALLDIILKDKFSRKPGIEELQQNFEFSDHEIGETTGLREDYLLLISPSGEHIVFSYITLTNGLTIDVEILAEEPMVSVFLEKLRSEKGISVITYQYLSFMVRLVDCKQVLREGKNTYTLQFSKEDMGKLTIVTEMGLAGYTNERIAEIRARRILLNKDFIHPSANDFNKLLEDVVISGANTPMKASKSPIPEIYSNYNSDLRKFDMLARLFAVSLLINSASVSYIRKLKFYFQNSELFVDFEGVREKRYSSSTQSHTIAFNEKVNLS